MAQQLSQQKRDTVDNLSPYKAFKNALVTYISDLAKSKTDLLSTGVYVISIKHDKNDGNKKNHGKHP